MMIKIQSIVFYTKHFKLFIVFLASYTATPVLTEEWEGIGQSQKKPRNLLRGLYLIEFVISTYSAYIHAPRPV